MSLDAMKQRFVDEIKLRGYDDKYIDKNEEREILHIAIQQGIGLDPARAALAQVCQAEGYVLESALFHLIRERCAAAATADRGLDRAGFDQVFAAAREAAQGRKNDRDLKKMVVTVMEDHGLTRVKTGWFTDWYAALKRELGMG